MKEVEKWQIKAIHALGGSLGLVERGNREDPLHILVSGITGKESVSNLTGTEANAVIAELKVRMKGVPPAPSKAKQTRPATPGGMTDGQQRKVWQLMYQLAALDAAPPTATLGERLCAVIRKKLEIDALPKEPFQWLNYKQGNQLIELLKRYISSADAKANRGDTHGLA